MAIDLAGTTEGIDLPGPVTVTKNRSALTGMAWVLFRSVTAPATAKIFGYSTGTNDTLSRFTLQWQSGSSGQLRVGGRALDTDPQVLLQSATLLTVGRWFHVVGIIDYANSFGYIYIDGALDIAGALTGTFGAAQTANTNTLDARWGDHEGSGNQGMNGLIEDGRLYNRILGPGEVKTIFSSRGKDGIWDGLLHRYPFDDGSPGSALVATVPLSGAERIVGTPIGSPSFAAGTVSNRMRRAHPTGRVW